MPRSHKIRSLLAVAAMVAAAVCLSSPAGAEVCNIKIVTDANPDYSDIGSMIHSITDNWPDTKDKCWAVWYWNHIGRRQTAPMLVHEKELTDPIMQFNDYGYTMCSTVAGVNTSIFGAMGLNTRYWDITNHTVMDVEYDGAFHMFDSSLSAIYTTCDGKRLAAVDEIGQDGACEASGGKVEPGHIAKYHCLTGSSPNGFLTGCDTQRSLAEEYKCFTPKWLKYRFYLQFWDLGHRYILNLRDGEIYDRSYTRLDADSKNAVVQYDKRPGHKADPAYFVPNNGKDPEMGRYALRGNGVRTWTPPMTAEGLAKNTVSMTGVKVDSGGITPAQAGQSGSVVFKVEGANVITSLTIKPQIVCKSADDSVSIAVSTCNGLKWTDVWKGDSKTAASEAINLIKEVNGAYEVLVKVQLDAKSDPAGAQLKGISFETITQLNAKTQPRLNIGKNKVYVAAGAQTESIVFWPNLHGESWKAYVVDMQNVKISDNPKDWMGTLQTAEDGKGGYVTFQIDAPNDITDFVYGGRFYNRERKPKCEMMHSFDGGKTWITSYTLTDTASPWDTIHYEKITDVPPGTKSVQFKYVLDCSKAGTMVCSLYGVRMEVHHKVADSAFKPMEVTFSWTERQEDYSTVSRSHTQLVDKVPFSYDINVGGADHPIVESLKVNFKGERAASQPVKYGYSDGNENADAKKYSGRWVTYGKILSTGKPYTCTEQPAPDTHGAGDPNGNRMTDGIVGSTYTDGVTLSLSVMYTNKQKPEITVDLGKVEKCGAFRIHFGGMPQLDALKGQIKDKVEVLTSKDGKTFTSQGLFDFNLRWKDIPANYMWPDEETLFGYNHELVLKEPVDAQYVKFAVAPARGSLAITEVQVLDFIKYDSFDLKLAVPDGKDRSDMSQYNPKHYPSKEYKGNKPAAAAGD